MKRGKPLRRYTPMPPPTKALKRTRLNPVSNKQRKADRENKPDRDALKKEFPYCMACGSTTRKLTVHEIAKGSHRRAACQHRFAQLVACWPCNSGPLNDYSVWPIERQLACQLVNMHKYFDLIAFNLLRGREPDAITMKDIEPYMPEVR